MEKTVLLRAVGVKKYFKVKSSRLFEKPGYLKAVDDVDLKIYEGETLGLVGESGCGKSTIGSLFVNLLSPTEGHVEYLGRSLSEMKRKELQDLKRHIQIIFQDPFSSLNGKKTIGWLMEEPLRIQRVLDPARRKQRVLETLHAVGLDKECIKKYPHELSGGQRQRVCIGLAIILHPRFIVADEAVSSLDVSIQAQVLNLLKKLQEENNFTYIFISHDLNVVHYISDRIAVMYLGKIVEIGEVDTIYENPMHPYTQALLSAIPTVEERKRERILLEGEVPSPINTPPGCAFSSRCWLASERCGKEEPALRTLSDGRQVKCHLYESHSVEGG